MQDNYDVPAIKMSERALKIIKKYRQSRRMDGFGMWCRILFLDNSCKIALLPQDRQYN